jgi:putative FmdB family regulatory protein
MPIYEYGCTHCGYRLDALQKVADAPLVDCPECGKPALKRLLSAPTFRLKGQGWYETDFKKDRQRNLHGEKDDKPAGDDKAKDKPEKDKPAADDKGKKSADKPAAKETPA